MGKQCSVFIWKRRRPFSVENPVHRDPITFPKTPCKVHSSWYSSLLTSEAASRAIHVICSKHPSVLGTTQRHNMGKNQKNCFGNNRGSSFLYFIFPKTLYSFFLYDYLSWHVIQSRAITRPPGKLKDGEWDVTASRAICQACRWILRSSWERDSHRELMLWAEWTK